MKKLVSIILALLITVSAFSGISFAAFAQGTDTLAVTVDGVTTNIAVGEKFTYTYALTDLDILNVEAMVSYDSSLMSLYVADDTDYDAYDAYLEQTFPLVYSNVVFNPNLTDAICYNFTTTNGQSFEGEQVLAQFEFTALAAGEASISTEIIEMVGADREYYVDKTISGSVLVKEFDYAEFITYEEPETEPATEPETEPATEPETEPVTEPATEPTEPDASGDQPSTEPATEPVTEPTEPVYPEKVENITYSATASTVKFNWDELEDATKYWVYQYSEEHDVWTSVVSAYTNEAVVKNLTGDTTYQFKVIARIGDNYYLSLDNADVIEVTTENPVATDSITATVGVTTAELTWEPIDGAVKYWVYKATSEEGPYYIYTSSVTNSCTVKRLRPDTTYYFKVIALTYENGIECYSKVEDSPIAEVVTGSASIITTELVENTATTATISWPAFENADKYWVRYSTTSADIYDNSHWTTWTSTTDTSYTFENLVANTVYYLNVCARYTVDGAVSAIDYIPVMVRTAYADENVITFTPVDEENVTLSWENSSDVVKTWVYTVAEDGTQTMLASTTENTVTVKVADYKNATFALKVLDTQNRYGYLTPSAGETYHE